MKVAKAGYPMGYLIAPVFIYPNWKEEYHNLLLKVRDILPTNLQYPVTFEVISHRYTMTAKNRINQVFPDNKLPMNEEDRKFKYGQFGYGTRCCHRCLSRTPPRPKCNPVRNYAANCR